MRQISGYVRTTFERRVGVSMLDWLVAHGGLLGRGGAAPALAVGRGADGGGLQAGLCTDARRFGCGGAPSFAGAGRGGPAGAHAANPRTGPLGGLSQPDSPACAPKPVFALAKRAAFPWPDAAPRPEAFCRILFTPKHLPVRLRGAHGSARDAQNLKTHAPSMRRNRAGIRRRRGVGAKAAEGMTCPNQHLSRLASRGATHRRFSNLPRTPGRLARLKPTPRHWGPRWPPAQNLDR